MIQPPREHWVVCGCSEKACRAWINTQIRRTYAWRVLDVGQLPDAGPCEECKEFILKGEEKRHDCSECRAIAGYVITGCTGDNGNLYSSAQISPSHWKNWRLGENAHFVYISHAGHAYNCDDRDDLEMRMKQVPLTKSAMGRGNVQAT